MTDFPDPTAYYRLTNSFTGPEAPLRVDPSSRTNMLTTKVADTKPVPQYWQILPTHTSDKFHICAEYAGSFLALDILREDKTKPRLTTPGHYSGQYWKITPWNGWGPGTFKLTNDYSGTDLHLDVYNDTKQGFMGDGDHTGQHWTFTKVAKPAPSQNNDDLEGSYVIINLQIDEHEHEP